MVIYNYRKHEVCLKTKGIVMYIIMAGSIELARAFNSKQADQLADHYKAKGYNVYTRFVKVDRW